MTEDFHNFTYENITDILSGRNLKQAYKNIKRATKLSNPSQILDIKNGPLKGKFSK